MKKNILMFIHLFILIPLFIFISIHFCYVLCNNCNFIFYYNSIFLFLIIYYIFYLFLIAVLKKSFVTGVIINIILFIFFVINQLKIYYTFEPLFLSDFNFLSQSSDLLNIVSGTFVDAIGTFSIYFIIVFICLIILSFWQYKVSFVIMNIKLRLGLFIGSVVLFLILFLPFDFTKDFYNRVFFDDVDNFNTYSSYVSYYGYYGIFGGFYGQMLNSRLDMPDNYNKNDVVKMISSVSNDDSKSLKKPNVILILSESFFDVSKIKDNVTFDLEVTKNFNELKKKGKVVEMISPTYGGLTANAVFELLVGFNTSYVYDGYIPFMELRNDFDKFPSLLRDFSSNDYYTSVIMGYDSYNCDVIFEAMCVDKVNLLEESDSNKKGDYISDEYVFDVLINDFDDKDGLKFYLVETMQSHMPYEVDKYDSYDLKIINSNLSDVEQDVLLSYAQGAYDADKMLKKVYDYINDIDEETIVVFFGDHLPFLSTVDGKNVLDKLNYFNTNDELINLYRKYNTQALILSNYEYELELPKNLSFDLLLTYLAYNMDIEVSDYYKWLYTTYKDLPASNHYVSIDSNNQLMKTDLLSGNSKKIYDDKYRVFYNYLEKR